MAVLARVAAALVLVTGCYAPDLRDCTVSCASSADCAGAQVCSSDHFCAATGTTCGAVTVPDDTAVDPADGRTGGPPHDAAVTPHDAAPPHDARPIDAAPPIDAPPPPIALYLHVDGNGHLLVGAQSCSMDCTFQVPAGVSLTVVAAASPGQHLDRWTAGPCAGSHGDTCTFTPVLPLLVAAKFKGGPH